MERDATTVHCFAVETKQGKLTIRTFGTSHRIASGPLVLIGSASSTRLDKTGTLHPGNEILQRSTGSSCRGCLLSFVAGAGTGNGATTIMVGRMTIAGQRPDIYKNTKPRLRPEEAAKCICCGTFSRRCIEATIVVAAKKAVSR